MHDHIHPQVLPLATALEDTGLFSVFVGREAVLSDELPLDRMEPFAEVFASPKDLYCDTHIEFLIEKILDECGAPGDVRLVIYKRYIPRGGDGPLEYSYDFIFKPPHRLSVSLYNSDSISEFVATVATSVNKNWTKHLKRNYVKIGDAGVLLRVDS